MRQKWSDGQEIIHTDLNNLTKRLERLTTELLVSKMLQDQSDKVFGQSFLVTRVDSNTLQVATGVGIQTDGTQVAPESTKRVLYLGAAVQSDITTPDATNNRIDIVSIKAELVDGSITQRRFMDAGTEDISTEDFNIWEDWEADVVITAGTPSGSPAVPSTPAGYIKIAEVLVTAVTGIAASGAITDKRPTFTIGSFDKVVGTGSHCTHSTLAEAIAASVAGDRILVENNETISTTVTISVSNIEITFRPNVSLTKGGAATEAINITGDGVRINGGRFVDFSGGGDRGIRVSSGGDYAILFGQRFSNCTIDVQEDSGTATILGNVIE